MRWVGWFTHSAALRTLVVIGWLFCIVCAFVQASVFGVSAPALGLCALATVWIVFRGPIVAWAARRENAALTALYTEAFERSDADSLAEVGALIARLWSSEARRSIALADELIVRHRWDEARNTLLGVEVNGLPPIMVAMVLNNLAYTTARAGDPMEGVNLAERASAAIEACHTASASQRSACRGTMAIALTLSGEHRRALPLLLEIVDEPDIERVRGERLYWLAVNHRALGQPDEAALAFARSASMASPLVDDARLALAERAPPYRDRS